MIWDRATTEAIMGLRVTAWVSDHALCIANNPEDVISDTMHQLFRQLELGADTYAAQINEQDTITEATRAEIMQTTRLCMAWYPASDKVEICGGPHDGTLAVPDPIDLPFHLRRCTIRQQDATDRTDFTTTIYTMAGWNENTRHLVYKELT